MRGGQSWVAIDEERADHIFRNAVGHFSRDSTANREILIEVASDRDNLAGIDRFGNSWFVAMRDDGTQIWVQVRAGKITNGGVNVTPRDFDFAMGDEP
jgi:hypothetical protein